MVRKMCPDHNRDSQPVRRTRLTHSGTMGSVPSTFATGYKYAGMGYTTAFDAAIPPLFARHAHEELEDTPCIDKGFYVLMGNNHYVMRSIQRRGAREASGIRRLAAGFGEGVCRQARQSGRRRGLEEPSRPETSRTRLARRPLRRHAATDHPVDGPGRWTSCGCPIRCTSTPTTSASPATGPRRSRR